MANMSDKFVAQYNQSSKKSDKKRLDKYSKKSAWHSNIAYCKKNKEKEKNKNSDKFNGQNYYDDFLPDVTLIIMQRPYDMYCTSGSVGMVTKFDQYIDWWWYNHCPRRVTEFPYPTQESQLQKRKSKNIEQFNKLHVWNNFANVEEIVHDQSYDNEFPSLRSIYRIR